MSAPTPEDKFGFDDNEARPALYDYENEQRQFVETYTQGSNRKFTRRIMDSLYGIDCEEAFWLGASALGAITIVGAIEYQDDVRNLARHSMDYVRERIGALYDWNLPR
jgi:hypothetical protein